MKTTYKRKLLNFLPYDSEGIEAYLHKQAQQGWQLDHFSTYLWVFRREESAELRYSVAYLEDVSPYDPENSPTQSQSDARYREAGWIPVAGEGKMRIYATKDPKAVPIDTDERIRLESIQMSMRGLMFLPWVLMLLIFAVSMGGQTGIFRHGPASPLLFLLFLACALVLLWSLFVYLRWVRKSKESIAEGGRCAPTRQLGRIWGISNWLILALALLWCLNEIIHGDSLGSPLFTGYIALAFLFGAVGNRVRRSLRRKGVSRGKNILITNAVVIGPILVLPWLALGLFIVFGLS